MRRGWAAALALAASVWAMPAMAAWQEASSRHFRVISDDAPDKVEAFATMLERFDRAMRVMRGMDDPPFSPTQRVTVYTVRNIGALQRLLDSDGAAGVYMPRLSGPVAFVPRETSDRGKFALTPQAVLLHEYAHHFMFSSWGERPFPAWFIEGFAEFNATAVFQPDRLLFGAPPLYRAYGLINDDILPVQRLLTQSPETDRFDGQVTQVFYGRSWLLTHYMLLHPERRASLSTYLKALENGKTLKAAVPLIGEPHKLDRALNAYARTTLPILVLKIADLPIAPVTVRALTPAEQAIMPVVLRSTRGVDRKSAPGVARDARRIAADWPTDPAVQVALAEAEFDAGQYAAADAAAARALAADPKLRGALIYRGMAQAALAHGDHVSDPARWKDIRQWFLKANRLDPEDPWPLVSFYNAYRASDEPMSSNAEKGLAYAYTLAPFDGGLAWQVAYMHLTNKRWKEAIPPLRRLAFDPHGGAGAAGAATLLTAAESGDTNAIEAAIAAVKAGGKRDDD